MIWRKLTATMTATMATSRYHRYGSPGSGPTPRHRHVTAEPGQRHEIRFQPAARRAIAQRLPEGVAAAALKFCEAALAVSPHRVGKPLFGLLAGCHGARRGTYRIIYRMEKNGRIVHVLDIDQRFSTKTPTHPQAPLYHA
jgi:mRNA interferase RelE/StbE